MYKIMQFVLWALILRGLQPSRLLLALTFGLLTLLLPWCFCAAVGFSVWPEALRALVCPWALIGIAIAAVELKANIVSALTGHVLPLPQSRVAATSFLSLLSFSFLVSRKFQFTLLMHP